MCGIAGYISKNKTYDKDKYISNTINSINHRGPDENGIITLICFFQHLQNLSGDFIRVSNHGCVFALQVIC